MCCVAALSFKRFVITDKRIPREGDREKPVSRWERLEKVIYEMMYACIELCEMKNRPMENRKSTNV